MVGGIDQNVGDGRVLQQRLQRPQAKHLVQHLIGQPGPLVGAERHPVIGHQLQNQREQLLTAARILQVQQFLEVGLIDQLAMDCRLHFLRPGQQ